MNLDESWPGWCTGVDAASGLECPEADSEVEHEFLCHVWVVGMEVAETQTEVEVIDTEMLRAEFQVQVGVCEPIGGSSLHRSLLLRKSYPRLRPTVPLEA